MPQPAQKFSNIVSWRRSTLLALSLTGLLVGCVVRVAGPPPPPPPPAYVPAAYSPPAYVPPAADPTVADDAQAAEAPPPLPEYEQPICPGDGYLWTPGYWRWYAGGYYWVPGTWVEPPRVGVLWTPPYWGFAGGLYVFHAGYWGPHVGFYGGVHYGFGYGGVGFVGGHWAGGSFAYNTAVMHVNTTVIHNTYNTTVVNNVVVNRVSYNGGAGGIAAKPTAQERIAAHEQHVQETPMQRQHLQAAVRNPGLAARANGGHPAIAATARPAAFHGPGVVGAHGAVAAPQRPFAAGAQAHAGHMPSNGAALNARNAGSNPRAMRGPNGNRPAGAKAQPAKLSQPKGPPRKPERDVEK